MGHAVFLILAVNLMFATYSAMSEPAPLGSVNSVGGKPPVRPPRASTNSVGGKPPVRPPRASLNSVGGIPPVRPPPPGYPNSEPVPVPVPVPKPAPAPGTPGSSKSEPVPVPAPMPMPEESPICKNVTVDIAPCLSYLNGDVDEPTLQCCVGVKSVSDLGSTKEVRQAICRCLQTQAHLIQNMNTTRSTNLPGQCKVDVGQSTAPDTDCDKIDGPPGASRYIVL